MEDKAKARVRQQVERLPRKGGFIFIFGWEHLSSRIATNFGACFGF